MTLSKLFAPDTGTRINFTLTEQSDCLKKLKENDPRYREAFAIIHRGKERLTKNNKLNVLTQ
jgi:hypothetical protein